MTLSIDGRRTRRLLPSGPALLRGRATVRRTLALCGFHIVLIWSLAIVVMQQNYDRAVEVWKTASGSLAVTVAAQGAQALAAADLVLKSVAEWVSDESIRSEMQFNQVMADRRFYVAMRERMTGLPQAGSVAIVSRDGDVVNSTTSWPAPRLNVGDREAFKAALHAKDSAAMVSATVESRVGGDWRFYVSRRVTSRSGDVVGVVSVGLEARYFADFYRRIVLGGPGSWVALYRSDGTLLASSLSREGILGRRFNETTSWRLINSGRSGSAELVSTPSPSNPEAGRRIVAAATVEGLPLYATVVVGEETFLPSWRERNLIIIGVAVLLTILTVLAGLRILRMIEQSVVSDRAASEKSVLAAIVDTPSALTAVADRHGRIVRCNAEFRRLLGIADDVTLSHVTANPAITGGEALTGFMNSGENAAEVNLQIARPPDQTRHLHFSLSRQVLPDTGECVIMVGHDETRRYRAEQAIALSGKLVTLGEITTGIAHELSQPLNVIRMAAQNALAENETENAPDAPPPMSDREFRSFATSKLSRIIAQVDRAAVIISRMRIFSRSTREGPQSFDLRDACLGAVALVAQPYRAAGIEVKQSLGDRPLLFVGHQPLIEQVLVSLLSNARDALATKPRGDRVVEISAGCRAPGRLWIRVHDSGPGVPEANRERIFEPFFTTKPEGHGTGLGLAVAFGIVRDAGGSLTLLQEGQGASFEVELPAEKGA